VLNLGTLLSYGRPLMRFAPPRSAIIDAVRCAHHILRITQIGV